MSVTKLIDIINPQVMGDMISAKIPAMLKYAPFAKVDTTLQGVPGNTVTVPRWDYIGDAQDYDVEGGAGIDTEKLTATSATFTIKCATKAVGVYQTAVNSGLGDPLGQAETQLAKSVAGKVDNDVLAAALTASLTHDGTAAKISYAGIVDAVGVFGEEEISDKVLFIHPDQVTTLRKDSDFISADKYPGNVAMSGEIGMIAGTRVVPSKKVVKVEYTKESGAGSGIVKVVASGASTGEVNLSAVAGKGVWDATNKVASVPAVGDYIKAVANAYYLCPVIKLEAADTETEYTADELPAITIYMKKAAQLDHEWLPKFQRHDFTVAEYYGVALTNAAKVVLASYKA